MFESLVNKRNKQPERGTVHLKGFPMGLNTTIPAETLEPTELSSCIDFKINPGGSLESRSPFRRFTSTPAAAAIKFGEEAILNGISYSLASDVDGTVYYLDGTDFVSIGTVNSAIAPFLISYNDICFVLDGEYIKYVDDTSGIKMAYDTGDDGVQYDKLTGNTDLSEDSISIGDGTNVRAAVQFGSQVWDTGYTIPLTRVEVKLSSTGSPTGTITCKLRKVSDDSVLASKDFSEDASEIASAGEIYIINFSSSDITTEMSPNTDYYCSIEHSGGDASNYISLVCLSDGSYGVSYTSSWSNETLDPIMKIYPSRPPKGKFGYISKNRPWVAGDPDNPGYIWFGNLSHLDWSTENGGGYVSTVDENRNSYPVGSIADLYGDLWIYGTESQPFLCKLQGSAPSNFALPLSFQHLWATERTLVNIGNDLWNATDDGVDSIYGVQAYGDVRAFSQSDKINNIIRREWGANSFAGYNAGERQFWLKVDGYDNIFIANLKSKYKDPKTGLISFPWNEYSVPEGVEFSMFSYFNEQFFMGSADGHLYVLDSSKHKDHINNASDTANIWPEFETTYTNFPLRTVDLEQIYLIADSKIGGAFDINIFTNGLKITPIFTTSIEMALDGYIIIDDLVMPIEDMDFTFDPLIRPLWSYLNINCWSFLIKVSVYITREPIYFYELIIPFERREK